MNDEAGRHPHLHVQRVARNLGAGDEQRLAIDGKRNHREPRRVVIDADKAGNRLDARLWRRGLDFGLLPFADDLQMPGGKRRRARNVGRWWWTLGACWFRHRFLFLTTILTPWRVRFILSRVIPGISACMLRGAS